MLYSEFKERQKRFTTALKIGAPFLALMIVYMSVFAIFHFEDDNFVLLLLFILVYIYYIFYMIYVGFQKSLIDDYTSAFNSQTIIKEVQKFLVDKKKNGYIAMISISNIYYIEEQYGVRVKNQIFKKITEKLNDYLILQELKKIPIGRYHHEKFLLIFENIKNEKQLQHILTGFCKEIKAEGIFKIEVKAESAVIEKTYDNNVRNVTLKLIDIINNVNNELRDILKPNEFDMLIRNAVNSREFEFIYHALRLFENIYDDPKIFTINTKLCIDHYGCLTLSQISSSVKKNGYEVKFDQLMISAVLEEIKLITQKHNDLMFIIKISAVSFRNRSFFIFLKELLKDINVEPKNICFLLSEKKTYDDLDRFKAIINEYKELGFSVALEHFGAYNIGLEYLKHDIKFDIVSFDLEYVKNLNNKNYFEILKSLMGVTKTFGIKSLVKFIDKEHMLYVLKEIKPNFVQGFLLDRPKSMREF